MKDNSTKKVLSFEDNITFFKIYNEKIDYYSTIIEILSKIKLKTEKYLKEILEIINLKADFSFISLIDDNYMKLVSFIQEEMILNIKRSIMIINDILHYVMSSQENIKSNLKNFTDFFMFQNSFSSKLLELKHCQDKYYKSAENAESFTFKFLDSKNNIKEIESNEFEKKNELQNICKEDKEKYEAKILEVNEELGDFNKNRQTLFNINKGIELYCSDNYSNSLASIYQFINEGTEGIEKKKEIKNNIIEITNKRKEIEAVKYKEKKKINFIQYKTKIDFNICSNAVKIGVYIMVGEEMRKIIGDYIQDKLEQCKHNMQLFVQIKNIINLDEKITEKDEEMIYSLLTTDNGRDLFIKTFNQLRDAGRKSKKFIEFISKVINKILDYESKTKELKYVKSCIILSQTYFYLDINNKKVYISEYLINNKLLNSPNFWRAFISKMIEIDFTKDNQMNNKNEIIFNQLLSYVQNMKEFKIDDRIIIKIIDELIKKYDYTDTNKLKSLFSFIDNDTNEIEKLRKEYLEKPDLEKQLYPEDIFGNNKVDKKE